MTEQEKVVQIGVPDERERRRRRYELLAAFLLLLLVLGGTWTQLTLYGVDSWMFIALLNINSIFMLIILFLVARNVVKLIMERRRKVFGAQIRTRLVVVFVSLSLIPTVIMFLCGSCGTFAQPFRGDRSGSRTTAHRLDGLQRQHASSNKAKRIRPYLGRLCHAAGEGTVLARPQSLYRGMAGSTHANRLDPCGQSDLRLLALGKGFEEYAQLKQLKKPLKVSFLLILGVLGMITIFGSVWFGFRLSKEFTAPILALAQGTTRIAQGDLDFRLEDKGADELGLLVQSFNHMAKDLQEGRMSLTHANAMLAEHNRYIETVLDNITTGVITLDADGRIRTMNKAASSIFDAQPERLEGRNPAEFLPRSYSNIFVSMLETLREHPEQNWKRQEDFLLGDRSWKLILHAVALSGPGGIRAYVIVVEDITELEKMQRMAAWREVAKRIAHEIKNPLTPIKLSAQRLDRKFGKQIEDPAFGQCTDLIVKQVERLQEMVQEFSSFAKLPEVQLSPDDVAPLLDELTTLFRTSHSSVMWDLHLPERLPKIALDPAALHRALLNIFTNAAEALDTLPPEATKRVRITAVHDRGRGSLRLIISDNGPGLQPEERERMFEPYFSRKKGGTGLGLAIVKSIIADHRGTIRAVAAQGGGTSIVLEFPVMRA